MNKLAIMFLIPLSVSASEKLMEPPTNVTVRPTIAYPVIKGTNTPNYRSNDRVIIIRGTVYPVIPGTNAPDYGKPLMKLK